MLALLAGLCGVVFAQSAIRAGRPSLALSVTPAHQSAVRGGTARFSIDTTRLNGFTGAIALKISHLPRGVSAGWQLTGGRRSSVVPSSETGSILTLRTSITTPLGTKRVRVVATVAGASRGRTLTLTVMPAGLRRFSLKLSPPRQTVPQGASATYRFRVLRAAHFHRRVSMRMLKLAPGLRATWSTNGVRIATKAGQRPASHRLVFEGTSWVGGKRVRRDAVVVLSIVTSRALRITGDLSELLYPGGGAPLDLVLTNPHDFDLSVSELSVRVGSSTSSPSCSGDANYAVAQYNGGYPLLLHPGITRLSALVPNSTVWPRVSMNDLPTNQDACKGVVVSLGYQGTATR
jgi:hypothetical protein